MSVCMSWSVRTAAGSCQSSGSVCSSHHSTIFYAFIVTKSGGSIICTHDGEIFHRHNSIPNVDKYNVTFHGLFYLRTSFPCCKCSLFMHLSSSCSPYFDPVRSFGCPLKGSFSPPTGHCASHLFVCESGVSSARPFRRLIPHVLQVQRDQCGENPASAAGAQAAEGHQQS